MAIVLLLSCPLFYLSVTSKPPNLLKKGPIGHGNFDGCQSDVTKVRFVNPAEEDVCQTNGGEEGQVII